MGSHAYRGSLCRYQLFPEIDDGTLCRQYSTAPGTVNGPTLWPELYEPGFFDAALGLDSAITDDDRAEFKLIKKMRVVDAKHRPYHSINQYVSDRTRYFGAPSEYWRFAEESDTELEDTKWVGRKRTRHLKDLIEFNHRGDGEKQKIFYRWVRKAYMKKYGDEVDVPELIRRGMSQELSDRLAQVRASVRVKAIHEEQFHAGGFNPRPEKYKMGGVYYYRLGTLSEHATGLAVDIEDDQNPQLTQDEWPFLQTLAGKKVSLKNRWKTEADAEALWKDIKAVSDLFVTKVASETARIEKERAEKEKAEKEKAEKAAKAAGAGAAVPAAGTKPGAAPVAPAAGAKPAHAPAKKVPTPLEEILGVHYGSLAKWAKIGFFHLPLDLVLELHAHGFVWGATFGERNVDLHHFEIPEAAVDTPAQ